MCPIIGHSEEMAYGPSESQTRRCSLIVEKDSLRSEYRIAIVDKAYPGEDGKVRKVDLSYKNYKVGEIVTEYSGAKNQVVSRSVQRLALIVPVDYDPDQAEKDLDSQMIVGKTRPHGLVGTE